MIGSDPGQRGCALQSDSWKACVFIATIAVTIDLLFVAASPVLWFAISATLVVGCQLWNQLGSLAIVMFACGLLSYSPYETGALSRLFPGDIAIALFLMTWLAKHRPWSIRRLFHPDLINRPLFALAMVVPLTMLWARLHPDPSVTYSFPHSDVSLGVTQISQLGLLAATICMPFAVARAIHGWKDIELVVLLMAAVAAIGTVVTGAAVLFGFGGSFEILGATRGYWEQPWHSSMPLTALVLPFLYSAILFGRRSVSSYGLVCLLFVMCLLGVVLTFSREVWVLALFGLLFVSGVRMRRHLVALSTLMIVPVAVLAVSIPGAFGAVARFYNPDEVYGFERVYLYLTGLQLFATHPVLGVGAGNYQFFDRVYADVFAGGIAHNQVLTIAAETGVVGLAAFLWFVIKLLQVRRRFRARDVKPGDPQYWFKIAASCFVLVWIGECLFSEAFFVSAAAGGGTRTITGPIFAWILLGLLFAACNLSQAATRTGTETSWLEDTSA